MQNNVQVCGREILRKISDLIPSQIFQPLDLSRVESSTLFVENFGHLEMTIFERPTEG